MVFDLVGGFLDQQMLALDAANLNQQSKMEMVSHAVNTTVILGHENPVFVEQTPTCI